MRVTFFIQMWGRWPDRLAAALWASDLVWLPSHIGIKGNELADSLANTATAKPDIDVNIGLELSEARHIVTKWQHFWNHETTGSHYRSLEKTVSTKVKYLHPSRHTEVIITKLRLGKCCINAYLHQIDKHQDGLCQHCYKPETVTHFLTECCNNATCSAVRAKIYYYINKSKVIKLKKNNNNSNKNSKKNLM